MSGGQKSVEDTGKAKVVPTPEQFRTNVERMMESVNNALPKQIATSGAFKEAAVAMNKNLQEVYKENNPGMRPGEEHAGALDAVDSVREGSLLFQAPLWGPGRGFDKKDLEANLKAVTQQITEQLKKELAPKLEQIASAARGGEVVPSASFWLEGIDAESRSVILPLLVENLNAQAKKNGVQVKFEVRLDDEKTPTGEINLSWGGAIGAREETLAYSEFTGKKKLDLPEVVPKRA